MKKIIIFILVALLLVCAVSCDKQEFGKLSITVDKTDVLPADKAKIAYATLSLVSRTRGSLPEAETTGVSLNVDDVLNGKVEITLPAGGYTNCRISLLDASLTPMYDGIVEQLAKPKTTGLAIEAGKTTPAKVELAASESPV